MCGGGGPVFLELEEMPWRKFRCSRCDREFRSMGRNPRCPDCGSQDLGEIRGDGKQIPS
ncbi:MAG: hydrogenase maturation nickel metallochaperone HypA [Methanomicrobiales archaeon]|nr:hydrogenase maturation nickel metallochaperone HypA [Methanomicrobiales archaeon]